MVSTESGPSGRLGGMMSGMDVCLFVCIVGACPEYSSEDLDMDGYLGIQ